MGIPLTVSLRADNTLTLTVPGQPVSELEPYMGTEFTVKGAEGYSIRFIMEDQGVKEAILIQPNGVFPAERKKED